jgi:hypothetical protein
MLSFIVPAHKPLGDPPPKSVRFFAASELLELVKDRT